MLVESKGLSISHHWLNPARDKLNMASIDGQDLAERMFGADGSRK